MQARRQQKSARYGHMDVCVIAAGCLRDRGAEPQPFLAGIPSGGHCLDLLRDPRVRAIGDRAGLQVAAFVKS
jgi:hypothetical protein